MLFGFIAGCDSFSPPPSPRIVSGSGQHRKIILRIEAVIHVQEKPAPQAALGRMRLTFMRLAKLHVTFRFALSASNACLVGENPTWSGPAL